MIKSHYTVCYHGNVSEMIDFHRDYQFDEANNYLTSYSISLKPEEGGKVIDNIQESNTIIVTINGSHRNVVIPSGSYTLDALIALINEEFLEFDELEASLSIFNYGANFGKAEWVIENHGSTMNSINLESAPDIMSIFSLEKEYYVNGNSTIEIVSNNVVDITNGYQCVQVFTNLIQGAPSVQNSDNKLLCNFILNDISKVNSQNVNKLKIPVLNSLNYVYFVFKSLSGKSLRLSGTITITLHINGYHNDPVINEYSDLEPSNYNTLKSQLTKQVCNLSFKLDKPQQIVDLGTTLNLKPNESFITRVSTFIDGDIYNITEDQLLLVNGAGITIKAGTWSLDNLLSELNQSTASFSVITDSENAFKLEICDFESIDFTNAQQMKMMLGFDSENDYYTGLTVSEYHKVDSTNNTIAFVVNDHVTPTSGILNSVTIPEGLYTIDDYCEAIAVALDPYVDIINCVSTTYGYIRINSTTDFYIDLDTSTINGFIEKNNEYKETTYKSTEKCAIHSGVVIVTREDTGESWSGRIAYSSDVAVDYAAKVLEVINQNGAIWFQRSGTAILAPRSGYYPAIKLKLDWYRNRKIGIVNYSNVANNFVRQIEFNFNTERIPLKGYRYCNDSIQLCNLYEQVYIDLCTTDSKVTLTATIDDSSTVNCIFNHARKYTIEEICQAIVSMGEMFNFSYTKDNAGTFVIGTGGHTVKFSDNQRNTFCHKLGLPLANTSSNITISIGNYSGGMSDDSFYFSVDHNETIPKTMHFTVQYDGEESSHEMSILRPEKCTVQNILSGVRNALNPFYKELLGDLYVQAHGADHIMLVYSMPFNSYITLLKCYDGRTPWNPTPKIRFGRTGSGDQLLDYVSLPTEYSNSMYVDMIGHRTLKLNGYYSQESYFNSLVNKSKNVPWRSLVSNMSVSVSKRYSEYTATVLGNKAKAFWHGESTWGDVVVGTTGGSLNGDTSHLMKLVTSTLVYSQGASDVNIVLDSGHFSFQELIDYLNNRFSQKGVPISFEKGENGYLLQGVLTFKLSGNFFTNNNFDIHKVNDTCYQWDYNDDTVCEVDGNKHIISANVVNFTMNKEILKVYCSIVNSKNENLLEIVPIVDLSKNIQNKSVIVPIEWSFNKVEILLKDNNENDFIVDGPVYLSFDISVL